MLNASCLTLGIFKFLYHRADLGAASEGFAATCTEEEANTLVKSFLKMVTRVIEMISLSPM
jgi:hypothetical protein